MTATATVQAIDANNLTREQLVGLVGEDVVRKLEAQEPYITGNLTILPHLQELRGDLKFKDATGDEIFVSVFHYMDRNLVDNTEWESLNWDNPHHFTYHKQ